MREFFKGWRRKAELVTLVVACFGMAAWMRSNFICDQILIQLLKTHHHLESHRGRVAWEHVDHVGDQFIKWESGDAGVSGPTQTGYIKYWDPFVWRWKSGDFAFGLNTYDVETHGRYLIVLYWSLVLPLTLLSAWLILGKTRKKQPSSTSDPRR